MISTALGLKDNRLWLSFCVSLAVCLCSCAPGVFSSHVHYAYFDYNSRSNWDSSCHSEVSRVALADLAHDFSKVDLNDLIGGESYAVYVSEREALWQNGKVHVYDVARIWDDGHCCFFSVGEKDYQRFMQHPRSSPLLNSEEGFWYGGVPGGGMRLGIMLRAEEEGKGVLYKIYKMQGVRSHTNPRNLTADWRVWFIFYDCIFLENKLVVGRRYGGTRTSQTYEKVDLQDDGEYVMDPFWCEGREEFLRGAQKSGMVRQKTPRKWLLSSDIEAHLAGPDDAYVSIRDR